MKFFFYSIKSDKLPILGQKIDEDDLDDANTVGYFEIVSKNYSLLVECILNKKIDFYCLTSF